MLPVPQANLRARLESSRQELLDLGLRNSLLNYRFLRGKGVEIVDEKPAEVYRLLVVERKSFTFLPIDEDRHLYSPPAEDLDQVGAVAERHKDTKLQTSLMAKQLQTRLSVTYVEIEEDPSHQLIDRALKASEHGVGNLGLRVALDRISQDRFGHGLGISRLPGRDHFFHQVLHVARLR